MSKLLYVFALFAVIQPANATTPRNPERLLKASNCEQAKKNLIEAKVGSPLLSKDENLRIVELLKQSVKRLCMK